MGPQIITFINAPIAQVDIIDEVPVFIVVVGFLDTHIHSFHRIMTIDLDHHSTLVSTKTTRIMKSEKRVECPKEGPVYAATRGGNVEDLRDMARMGKRFVQTQPHHDINTHTPIKRKKQQKKDENAKCLFFVVLSKTLTD